METTELGELVHREMENEKIQKDGAQRSSIQETAERRSRMWHPGHQGGQLLSHLPIYSIVHKAWPGRLLAHSMMLLLINGDLMDHFLSLAARKLSSKESLFQNCWILKVTPEPGGMPLGLQQKGPSPSRMFQNWGS